MESHEIINPIPVNRNRFNVQVEGQHANVSEVFIKPNDTNATFILANAVGLGSNVLLNHLDSKRNQSAGVIEALFGNDFAPFRNFSVDVIESLEW